MFMRVSEARGITVVSLWAQDTQLTSDMTLTHSSRSLLSPCHVSWTLYSIAMSGVNVTHSKSTKSSIYQCFIFVSHQYFYGATGHLPLPHPSQPQPDTAYETV